MSEAHTSRFWLPGHRTQNAPPAPIEPQAMRNAPLPAEGTPPLPLEALDARKKPNILIVLTDDQGYGDLSCMGSEWIRTPHIDRLAAAGCLCTAFYSASSACSPARASLLTGLMPGKAGVRSMLSAERDAVGLPDSARTLSKLLKEQEYATAYFGKWHLGAREDARPEFHGFDRTLYFTSEEIDPFSHIHSNIRTPLPLHDLWENGMEAFYDGEYISDLITERALRFIRVPRKQPFFMVLSYSAPHFPHCAPKALRDRFAQLPRAQQALAASLSAVDDGLGAVLDELVRQKIAQDTLILFTSDNGPSREPRQWMDGSDRPFTLLGQDGLKGGKYSLFEGGIRMPGVLCWPGTIPGGQLVEDPLSLLDTVPTALAAAGAPLPDGLDGLNLLPRLTGQKPLPQRDLFFEMMGQTAMRSGRWKLVLNGQEDVGAPIQAPVFLADLENDRGETVNLYDQFPSIGNELADRALAWRMSLEDQWQRKHAPRYQRKEKQKDR